MGSRLLDLTFSCVTGVPSVNYDNFNAYSRTPPESVVWPVWLPHPIHLRGEGVWMPWALILKASTQDTPISTRVSNPGILWLLQGAVGEVGREVREAIEPLCFVIGNLDRAG